MNPSRLLVPVVAALAIGSLTVAESQERSTEIRVSLQALDVDPLACFDLADWFRHPAELIAAGFSYPPDMERRGITGETSILVQVTEEGRPRYLRTLLSTQPDFAHAAIEALKGARWQPTTNQFRERDVWFIYRVRFFFDNDEKPVITTEREPNKPVDPTPRSAQGNPGGSPQD